MQPCLNKIALPGQHLQEDAAAVKARRASIERKRFSHCREGSDRDEPINDHGVLEDAEEKPDQIETLIFLATKRASEPGC